MGAGDYYDRVRLLTRSLTRNETNGQEVESFTASGLLWVRIEVNGGRKQQDIGANQTGVIATIYVRGMPSMTAQDRIYAIEWDETWVIESIYRGANELICDCIRWDDLTTHDITGFVFEPRGGIGI